MTEKQTAVASTSKRANQSIVLHQELLNEDRNAIYFSIVLFTQPSKAPDHWQLNLPGHTQERTTLASASFLTLFSLSICYLALSKRSWLFCLTWHIHLHIPDQLQDERAEQFTTAKSTKGQIRQTAPNTFTLHHTKSLYIRSNNRQPHFELFHNGNSRKISFNILSKSACSVTRWLSGWSIAPS